MTPFRRAWLVSIVLAASLPAGSGAASPSITVESPPALEATAERIRTTDTDALATALAEAGLDAPDEVRITLIDEDDPRARMTPPWIAGMASGRRNVAIFPARVGSYPHGSLDGVVRHEIVHLALFAQAGGRPLPRWFHEGVAVTVERGWDLESQVRLVLATIGDPALADLRGLFASEAPPETARAYLLAAALVAEIRQRHGASVPGAIARGVARGATFADAFRAETGETPEGAAARTWRGYQRWTSWIPVMATTSSWWSGILMLAVIAFLVRLRRRAVRRRQWDDED